MATAVVMPKQGQSVESCIIVGWKKSAGDAVTQGEVLCEVETDKALLEVECPVAGILLAIFFAAGEEVPVLTNIAVIGELDEAVDDFQPAGQEADPVVEVEEPVITPSANIGPVSKAEAVNGKPVGIIGVSPRARNLAQRKNLKLDDIKLQGSGPGGRIIERDVQALLDKQPKLTPLAESMVNQGGYNVPLKGSGVGGRVMSADLVVDAAVADLVVDDVAAEEVKIIPLKGVRKVIAGRMLESLQSTAQLTLNASADARAIQAYRRRLKSSREALGLQNVNINDLIMFAVSRILLQYPEMNSLFSGDTISQYKNVHLGLAVDTPRGLMVPVIPYANTLSLKQISNEAKRLALACQEGNIKPDEIRGGTFTLTNLGGLGIESFTPILNPPEVGILGLGNINLKPLDIAGEVQFIPHIGLSLTINHQVVDGAPAARFLQTLSQSIADFELLLAL